MSKKLKPVTDAAKADAELTTGYRKVHPKYDSDVTQFGRSTADYNAGWLACDAKHKAKLHKKKKAR